MAFIMQWLPIVLIALAMGLAAIFLANNVQAVGKLVAKTA